MSSIKTTLSAPLLPLGVPEIGGGGALGRYSVMLLDTLLAEDHSPLLTPLSNPEVAAEEKLEYT